MTLALIVAGTVVASAEEKTKYYSLTYKINDGSCNNTSHDHYNVITVPAGTEITLSSTLCGGSPESGESFLGWFSDDGVLYAPGEKLVLNRNTVLRIAVGKTVNTANELYDYLKSDMRSFWNYAMLGADISYSTDGDETFHADWHGCGVIDLNGHTLTSGGNKHGYGFGTTRTGLIIAGEGTINFTSRKPLEGAFFTTARHSYGDGNQRLWIGKNVKIISNAPLVKVTNPMTAVGGKPTIEIHGDITAPSILWTNGAFDIDVNLYSTCKLTVPEGSKKALIYDGSTESGYTIATLWIHGGTFNFPSDFKGFITMVDDEPDDRLAYKINGGTFNRDLSTIIPITLRVRDNGDGTFSILENPCSKAPEGSNGYHRYVAVQIGVDCVTSGSIKYRCTYCDEAGCDGLGGDCFCDYEIKRDAFGHSFVSVLAKDIVNTKKETSPGETIMTCSRCGETETTYEYPDPNRVYITLKIRYTRDVNGTTQTLVENIRVPSETVFGFKLDTTYGENWTYINSFSITPFKYTFDDGYEHKVMINEVIGVEIPLGTTRIQKELFKGNENIEWIKLREGIKYVEDSVFAKMPKLTKIEGIEFIEDYIGSSAFAQDDITDPLTGKPNLVLDTIEVNARDVGASAFKNILTTRIIIGENVRRLKDAFRVEGNTSKYDTNKKVIKEIFIKKINKRYDPAEHPDMYGISLANVPSAVWTALFEEFSTTSTLLARGKLYYDHSFDTITHMPNCLENGYVAHECVQCGLHTVSEYIPNTGIKHEWVEAKSIPSTCSTPGMAREYCERCDSYREAGALPLDPKKHDFSSTDPEPTAGACTSTNWEYRRRCAYGCGTFSSNIYKKGDGIVLGHYYSNDPTDYKTIPSTCTTPGKTIKTCKRCLLETEVGDSIPLTPHSWVSSLHEAATCKSPAKYLSTCTVCGLTEILPDRDANGNEKIPSYEEAVEKNLHKWEEKVLVQPTTEEVGYKSIKCSVCNKNKRDANTTIPKLTQGKILGFVPIIGGSATVTWIVVGAVAALLVGGALFTLIFLLTKKKNKSTGYKYKFNTFKK